MNLKITCEINGVPHEAIYEDVKCGEIKNGTGNFKDEPALFIFNAVESGRGKRVYLPFDWIKKIELLDCPKQAVFNFEEESNETLESIVSSISDSV